MVVDVVYLLYLEHVLRLHVYRAVDIITSMLFPSKSQHVSYHYPLVLFSSQKSCACVSKLYLPNFQVAPANSRAKSDMRLPSTKTAET